MKTWNIKVRETSEYWATVEAETLDEAKELAKQTSVDDSSTIFSMSREIIDHELSSESNNSND